MQCTTGNKTNDYKNHPRKIEVLIGGSKLAVVSDSIEFFYGLRWSGDNTWGGEAKPREGDSVWVPAG